MKIATLSPLAASLFVASLVVASAAAGHAQAAPAAVLTDAQVQRAIDRGTKQPTDKIGLSLDVTDRIEGFLTCVDCDNIEYMATVYTPPQWIELKAALAEAAHRTYTPADVSADLRKPVLHVNVTVLHYVGAQTRKMPPLQVQLTGRRRHAVVRPFLSDSEPTATYFSRSHAPLAYISKEEAVFDLAAMHRLLHSRKFFIAINTGDEKKYLAVKTKDIQLVY
jgi:hypothetical protein